MEFGTALRKFLSELDRDEFLALQKDELVFEEDVAAEFFDSIQEGDVVGVGLLHGLEGEPAAYRFQILSVNTEEDTMYAKDVSLDEKEMQKYHPDYKGAERELSFEEMSVAFGLGFGEILERDGKPFGVSEEIEQVVRIFGPKEELKDSEEKEEEPTEDQKESEGNADEH